MPQIVRNNFEVVIERWDDPGDYPSGAGAGPLPSYNYVSDVEGELAVRLEPLEECVSAPFAYAHADIPEGVTVKEWDISIEGDLTVFRVQDFDANDWQPPEPDYDDREDVWASDYDYGGEG